MSCAACFLGILEEMLDGFIVACVPWMKHLGGETLSLAFLLPFELKDSADRTFAQEIDDLIVIEQDLPDEPRAKIKRLTCLSTEVGLWSVRFSTVWTPWHGAPSAPTGERIPATLKRGKATALAYF